MQEPPAKRPCSNERALRAMTEGLYCSITNSLFVDPVSADDGQIYERAAISRWLGSNDTSPVTGAVLASKRLVALPAVRTMVAQVVEAGTLPDDEVREWLLRKGIWAGDTAEAKELLSRAVAMGSVDAGYYYARRLIIEAAEAGMQEAQAALLRLDGSASQTSEMLYVVGGDTCYTKTIECFDSATQAWTKGSSIPMLHQTRATVLDGKIYAIGERRVIPSFDPAAQEWTSSRMETTTPRSCACVVSFGDKIYVMGGYLRDDLDGGNLRTLPVTEKSVECFNPARQEWTVAPDMGCPRKFACAAVLHGKIYVIGGHHELGASRVECFDPATEAWTEVPNMYKHRDSACAAVLGGKIYVMGGVSGRSTKVECSVECFDPITQVWTRAPAMNTKRYGACAAVLGGRIYVMGGKRDVEEPMKSVECFDPATRTWTAAPAMGEDRYCSSAVVL